MVFGASNLLACDGVVAFDVFDVLGGGGGGSVGAVVLVDDDVINVALLSLLLLLAPVAEKNCRAYI